MPKLVDNYVLCRKIGAGQFGQVLKGYQRTTNSDIAVKVIKRQNLKGKFLELLQNQIKVLKACDNKNIIKLYDLKKTPNNFYLILQFCNQGDLAEYVKKKKHLTEEQAVEFLIQILNAFKTLVKNKIIHRDLKLANILLHDGEAKVGDFGFAKLLTEQQYTKTILGSPLNMAPEVLNGQLYTNKADIYSLGVCFYQMLYGKPPYNAGNMIQLAKKIKKGQLQFPQKINKISQTAENLIRQMLNPQVSKRIDWPQLFQHPITRLLDENVQNEITATLGKGGNLLSNISKFYIKQNLVILHPAQILKKQELNNYAFEIVKNNKKVEYKGQVIRKQNFKISESKMNRFKRQQITNDKLQQKQSKADLILKAMKRNTQILLNERNKYIFILSILNQLSERIQKKNAKEICYQISEQLMKKINEFEKIVKNKQNIFNLEFWSQYLDNNEFKVIQNYFDKQVSIINYEYQQMKKYTINNNKPLPKLIKEYGNFIIEQLKNSKKILEQISRVTWIHIDHLIDYLNVDKIMKSNKESEFNFKLFYLENGKITMNQLTQKVTKKLSQI